MRIPFLFFILLQTCLVFAQSNENSNTRNLINKANLSLIERDKNHVAILKSGIGETVTFFPIEITDLKTGQTVKALQVNMSVKCRDSSSTRLSIKNFSKIETSNDHISSYLSRPSYVDYEEIGEFMSFLEKYVIPRISVNTVENKTLTYEFTSKEIMVQFQLGDFTNRLSFFLKDNNNFDEKCFFWTETQIGKTQELLAVLQSFKP